MRSSHCSRSRRLFEAVHAGRRDVFEVAGEVATCLVLASLCASCRSRGSDGAAHDDIDSAAHRTASFVCDGPRCVQRYPRLPDDGEWTCNDTLGATVCSGGDPPAGVPLNLRHPAFRCGERGATLGRVDGERVCVDLTPDFPGGTASGWRCHYATEGDPTRVCERDAQNHVIGDPCGRSAPCVDGLSCTDGRCTPAPPSPSCILDADCKAGVCRLGSCFGGAP